MVTMSTRLYEGFSFSICMFCRNIIINTVCFALISIIVTVLVFEYDTICIKVDNLVLATTIIICSSCCLNAMHEFDSY